MTEPRRWDVQIDVHGPTDIRHHVNSALTKMVSQLTTSGIGCTITAFDGDGDAYNSWDNLSEAPAEQNAASINGDLPFDLATELRGCMDDGYDDDRVNRIFGQISDACGLQLVCVWDYHEPGCVGGHSQFFVDLKDGGPLRELVGDLWHWLNDYLNDEDSPTHPGTPASWIGPATEVRVDQLAWNDGLHNHATHNRS